MIAFYIIVFYLSLLLLMGYLSSRLLQGTANDFFLASRTIGPFLLLMTLFGTTMTAFALVGSTGEAYREGIGVYGLMASISGIVHSAVFFFIGIRLWAFGKRYGYTTQVQYFRDRFQSDFLGLLIFPVLVALVLPYLLIGVMGGSTIIKVVTSGAFPVAFAATNGGVPPWLGGLAICLVVLIYISWGGLRGAAWANAFQTIVFMVLGVVAFYTIAEKLGGVQAATQRVAEYSPHLLIRGEHMSLLKFTSYLFIPLSVGMFPHIFQHWLTARSAKTFRLPIIAHPIFIMIVWVPCVLIGVWASSALMANGTFVVPKGAPPNAELAIMIRKLTNPWLTGFLSAGILAAVMSSLDSQFLCLGSMFTNDILLHYFGKDRFSDKQKILCGRIFVVLIVSLTYVLSLFDPRHVFTLGVWCFSGFASLFPLVFAALYWKRATKAGAFASVLVAAILWGVLFADAGWGADRKYLFYGMMPVVPMFFGSALAMWAVSLVTRPPSEEVLNKFFFKRKEAAVAG